MCLGIFLLFYNLIPAETINAEVDPITRYFHIKYSIPHDAPDDIVAVCSWSEVNTERWQSAKVTPFISETAMNMASSEQWEQWTGNGRITERNTTGLARTVIFDPFPEAQNDGKVDVDFRIQIQTLDDQIISTWTINLKADNSDVFYIQDWSGVFQKDAISKEADKGKWHQGIDGKSLYASGGIHPLPQLSYPLDLSGVYAIFVRCSSIELRLTGDERVDKLSSRSNWETLWRWTRMDRQHLVLKQPHDYNGWRGASIEYVKMVPLSHELTEKLDSQFSGEADKFIAGYWEPYSWAFHEHIRETLQHRSVLTAFKEARFSLVDSQINRFGAKSEFETRVSDQLLFNTQGDPNADETIPVTDGVGRMQQFTNALDATIRYTEELGLQCHANFGASASYVGTPLQGDFSKQHPEWLRGSQLRFEVPEVREYALSMIREALEIGAPGISIDFMRYSFTIPDAETCNIFLRELRSLVDEFEEKRSSHINILVQFPGKGVLPPEQFKTGSWDLFHYQTWAKEGWVDYICPSNDDERHLHLDVKPYLEAVKDTKCKVLPNVTAAGLPRPGLYLWRIKQLYDAGVDGIYIYQSDQCVLGSPMDRRCARLLTSSRDVENLWKRDARLRASRSKGIYITHPSRPNRGWRPRERVRIWLEGIEMGEVEIYLNGKLVNHYYEPPYLLGTEERDSDNIIPKNRESELLIKARDGDGWLEQKFTIHGEKPR